MRLWLGKSDINLNSWWALAGDFYFQSILENCSGISVIDHFRMGKLLFFRKVVCAAETSVIKMSINHKQALRWSALEKFGRNVLMMKVYFPKTFPNWFSCAIFIQNLNFQPSWRLTLKPAESVGSSTVSF